MPNPYHYRAHINRLTRLTTSPNPGYIRLKAVCALLRELSPANPHSAVNNRMLQSIDPYEFARHKLRDLYDHASHHTKVAPAQAGASSQISLYLPLPLGEGWGEGSPTLTEQESPEEDDDPL